MSELSWDQRIPLYRQPGEAARDCAAIVFDQDAHKAFLNISASWHRLADEAEKIKALGGDDAAIKAARGARKQ